MALADLLRPWTRFAAPYKLHNQLENECNPNPLSLLYQTVLFSTNKSLLGHVFAALSRGGIAQQFRGGDLNPL